MTAAMIVGCSPQAPPVANTPADPVEAIEPAQTEPVIETESPSSASAAPPNGNPTEPGIAPESPNGTAKSPNGSDTSTRQTPDESLSDDDVKKFIGQDGRERVVPTGPPPTDRDGRLELTFDDLSFEMEKGGKFERSMLTERIKKFHGEEVRLRGFIRPSFRQSKIEKFVFVRDDKECCFGPGAAIYDNALVSLKKGTQTDYTVRPVVVVGQLYLKEYETPDGMVLSIYRIKQGKIE